MSSAASRYLVDELPRGPGRPGSGRRSKSRSGYSEEQDDDDDFSISRVESDGESDMSTLTDRSRMSEGDDDDEEDDEDDDRELQEHFKKLTLPGGLASPESPPPIRVNNNRLPPRHNAPNASRNQAVANRDFSERDIESPPTPQNKYMGSRPSLPGPSSLPFTSGPSQLPPVRGPPQPRSSTPIPSNISSSSSKQPDSARVGRTPRSVRGASGASNENSLGKPPPSPMSIKSKQPRSIKSGSSSSREESGPGASLSGLNLIPPSKRPPSAGPSVRYKLDDGEQVLPGTSSPPPPAIPTLDKLSKIAQKAAADAASSSRGPTARPLSAMKWTPRRIFSYLPFGSARTTLPTTLPPSVRDPALTAQLIEQASSGGQQTARSARNSSSDASGGRPSSAASAGGAMTSRPSTARSSASAASGSGTPTGFSASAFDDEAQEEQDLINGPSSDLNDAGRRTIMDRWREKNAAKEPAIPAFWREFMVFVRILMVIVLCIALTGCVFVGSALFSGKISWSASRDSLSMFTIDELSSSYLADPVAMQSPYAVVMGTTGNALFGTTALNENDKSKKASTDVATLHILDPPPNSTALLAKAARTAVNGTLPILKSSAGLTVDPVILRLSFNQTKGMSGRPLGHRMGFTLGRFMTSSEKTSASTSNGLSTILPYRLYQSYLNSTTSTASSSYNASIVVSAYSEITSDKYIASAAIYQSTVNDFGYGKHIVLGAQEVRLPYSPMLGGSLQVRGCTEFPLASDATKPVSLCHRADGLFAIEQSGQLYVSVSKEGQLFLRGQMIYNQPVTLEGLIKTEVFSIRGPLVMESIFNAPQLIVTSPNSNSALLAVALSNNLFRYTNNTLSAFTFALSYSHSSIDFSRNAIVGNASNPFIDLTPSIKVISLTHNGTSIQTPTFTAFSDTIFNLQSTQQQAKVSVRAWNGLSSSPTLLLDSASSATPSRTHPSSSAFYVTHSLSDNAVQPRYLVDDLSRLYLSVGSRDRLIFNVLQTYNTSRINRQRYWVPDFSGNYPNFQREITIISPNQGGGLIQGMRSEEYLTGLNKTSINYLQQSATFVDVSQFIIRSPPSPTASTTESLLLIKGSHNATLSHRMTLESTTSSNRYSTLSLEQFGGTHQLGITGYTAPTGYRSSIFFSSGFSTNSSLLKLETIPDMTWPTFSHVRREGSFPMSNFKVLAAQRALSFKMRASYNSLAGTNAKLLLQTASAAAASSPPASLKLTAAATYEWVAQPSTDLLLRVAPANETLYQLMNQPPLQITGTIFSVDSKNISMTLYPSRTSCQNQFVSLGDYAGFYAGMFLSLKQQIIVYQDGATRVMRVNGYKQYLRNSFMAADGAPIVPLVYSSNLQVVGSFYADKTLDVGQDFFITKPVIFKTVINVPTTSYVNLILAPQYPYVNKSRVAITSDATSTLSTQRPLYIQKSLYPGKRLLIAGNTTTFGANGLVFPFPSNRTGAVIMPLYFQNISTGEQQTLYRNMSASWISPTLELQGQFQADKTSLVEGDLFVTGTLSGSFSVNPGHTQVTLASLQTSGRPFDSIRLPTGRLAIALVDTAVPAQIKVIYCKVVNCTDNYISVVDRVPDLTGNINFGSFVTAFITTAGKLAVAYPRTVGNLNTLSVGICADVICSRFSSVSSPISGLIINFPSIQVTPDGLPLIAFNSGNNLYVAKCTDTTCSVSVSPRLIASGLDSYGIYTSLVIGSDGLPFIAFHDKTSGNLVAVHCRDFACLSNDGTQALDGYNGYSAGAYISATVNVDGFILIAHQEFTGEPGNERLRILKCGDLKCTPQLSSTSRVDNDLGSGQYNSITIGDDGLPVIASFTIHIKQADGARMLKISHCCNIECTDAITTIIDGGSNMDRGQFASLAIGTDFLPAVAYYNTKDRTLKLHHCTNRMCINYTRFTRYT